MAHSALFLGRCPIAAWRFIRRPLEVKEAKPTKGMPMQESPDYEEGIQECLDYLNSPSALESLRADCYWPKWDSPWWHMLLLHEMGETYRLPKKIIDAYISSLNHIALKIFPIHSQDLPPGIDPYRGYPCHCQLGNVYQVLATYGVDVDEALPWIKPWFLRYQMADGGLNCDRKAYLVEGETPSSMVGTIAAFETILLCSSKKWTDTEKAFLEKGAQFLIGRKLILGSDTVHNAAERLSAKDWQKPSFPRFYFYDSLRGLLAVLRWSIMLKRPLPVAAIQDFVLAFHKQFPDGKVHIERRAFADVKTLAQASSGQWQPKQPARYPPLLQKVSAIGGYSPFLSKQWAEAKNLLSQGDEWKNLLQSSSS